MIQGALRYLFEKENATVGDLQEVFEHMGTKDELIFALFLAEFWKMKHIVCK